VTVSGATHGDRPDLYVVARLLERLWRQDSPIMKTRLQVAANVNYDVFSRYLEWMVGRGLVSLENSADGHERVALTPKGREAYRRLVQWIHDIFQGGVPGSRGGSLP
jgi:predicted transcriptional regulator